MATDSTFEEDVIYLWRTLRSIVLVLVFIFGAIITSLIVGYVGIVVLDQASPVAQQSETARFLASAAFSELGYAIFVSGLLYWKTDFLPAGLRFRRPTHRDARWILGGILVMIVTEYVLTSLFTFFNAPTAQNAAAIEATKHASLSMFGGLIVLSLLITGPCEEILFRGLIQGYLRRHFSAIGAILLASLFFASVHLFALQGSLSGIRNVLLSLFALSLILGFAYERTDSLFVPILIHGSYNAILFANLGLSNLY
ncbi:CPBP family intramembrane glutamic endopeptidase [Halobellus rufus]|jgi:membrane protease YdiL (CAAX protease family)|uniref:CPBP family intramembrane glutamic endopeptidase n=1 Tax=Halobellus rufus TaxID=1448860 RepID=UPI000679E337|nr:type II CAAX endopeptidase family protein [Halobellus rufus]